MVGQVSAPVLAPAERLPDWVTGVRAPNPGPMTLDGTNSWVLATPGGRTVVVDPGPDDEAHLATLAAYRPSLILVTHGHPDHVDGLRPLLGMLGDTQVWTEGEVRRSLDGLDIALIATPGHTDDSVCFRVEAGGERVIVTGDTILGQGTAAHAYLAHRKARLAQVREALSAGARTPRQIVEIVYADIDRAVWPAAEATVAAQLAYLESSGPGVRWDTP